MQRTAIKLILLLAVAAVPVLGATGCGDDVTAVTNIVEDFLFSTRANSVLTVVYSNWFAPTGVSINPHPENYEHEDLARLFCCSNGTAIYAFYETDEDDAELLWLGFIDAAGTMHRPVCIEGDFVYAYFDTLMVVFNQHGDASILYSAFQDDDPSDDDDERCDRIYYTWFRSGLATTADNGNGVQYGFNTWSTAVDRNTVDDDDESDLFLQFAATNLIDGTLAFSGTSSSIEEAGCSGSRGLSLDFFLFLGWGGIDTSPSDDTAFLEGHFVDLDNSSETYLELIGNNPVELDTAASFSAADGDSIGNSLWTSGRDILFEHNDADNGTTDQSVLNLVRVDAADTADPELGNAIAVTRGASDTPASVSVVAMIGGGLTPYNGQTATWVVFLDIGYTDTDVAADDTDLLIARIGDDDNLDIDEFDHDLDSGDDNPVDTGLETRLQTARGFTHGLVSFGQADDVTAGTASDSLFAVGVVFSDAGTFANLISDATLLSSDPDDVNGDTDVSTGVESLDPASSFCALDSDPLDFGLLFLRERDNDADLVDLVFAEITFDAVEADPGSPPVLTADDTIINTVDSSWLAPGGQVVDGGNGGFLVLIVTQFNNPEDPGATGAFDEVRALLWSTGLDGGDFGGIAVDSAALGDDLPFADWQTLTDEPGLRLTPGDDHAGRDSTWDLETASPDYAHVFVQEYAGSPDNPFEALRYRAIDLTGTVATAADRLHPDLDSPMAGIIDKADLGGSSTIVALLTQGNNATLVLREQDDESAEDFITVSTLDTSTHEWVERAAVTNDITEVSDWSYDAQVFPGRASNTCCEQIIGGWIFYVRYDANGYLQARRFHSLNLDEPSE